jgi:phage-related protein
MPHARPMRTIGPRCLELRIRDEEHNWRVFCRTDLDAVLILGVHDKKTSRVPPHVLATCRARAQRYDRESLGS